jgi:hypothetical protein
MAKNFNSMKEMNIFMEEVFLCALKLTYDKIADNVISLEVSNINII